MLQLIDEFLPVKEFAGRVVNVGVLRDFGLVENEHVGGYRVHCAGEFFRAQPKRSSSRTLAARDGDGINLRAKCRQRVI